MTAYRFCRTDDRALLIAAYERCRGPEDAGAPALDVAGFKQLVRRLDLWCSSCMVAFEGREPVGVLLGAKRPDATLVYGLRVHPGHRRRGHARHLLTSLGQKLAILGPPALVAEVPAERAAACAAFSACGWKVESRLRDWRREAGQRSTAEGGAREAVAPVTFEELSAAGLLGTSAPDAATSDARPRCWQRDLASLAKRGAEVSGLAFHSPDCIEAWVLYEPGAEGGSPWQVLAAGLAPGALGRAALAVVIEDLARLAGDAPLHLQRAAPGEHDAGLLAELGFSPGTEHLLFTARAQAA